MAVSLCGDTAWIVDLGGEGEVDTYLASSILHIEASRSLHGGGAGRGVDRHPVSGPTLSLRGLARVDIRRWNFG